MKITIPATIVLLIILPLNAQVENPLWGWQAHQYINAKAVDYLPQEMAFFSAYQSWLSQHAIDPDTDDNPGYYHYIDIDYYGEFFSGTLPHTWDDIIDLYGYSVVTGNGTIPWVIDRWADSLRVLMSENQWDDAWQVAAELGHYVADSHQPLHLTLNYNGQNSGNYGIHSRYETSMINPHLDQLPLPDGEAHYWVDGLDSVFHYIDTIYPSVALIMAADDTAKSVDPGYGTTYYTVLWDKLDSITTDAIHNSILDLASIWYSAWIDAGSPSLGAVENHSEPGSFSLGSAFPNPFNPTTTIEYEISFASNVQISIYDLRGREVEKLIHGPMEIGKHSVIWDASSVASGMYFYRIQAGDFVQTKKMVVLK